MTTATMVIIMLLTMMTKGWWWRWRWRRWWWWRWRWRWCGCAAAASDDDGDDDKMLTMTLMVAVMMMLLLMVMRMIRNLIWNLLHSCFNDEESFRRWCRQRGSPTSRWVATGIKGFIIFLRLKISLGIFASCVMLKAAQNRQQISGFGEHIKWMALQDGLKEAKAKWVEKKRQTLQTTITAWLKWALQQTRALFRDNIAQGFERSNVVHCICRNIDCAKENRPCTRGDILSLRSLR